MAGLSAGIGSAPAFFADRTNTRFLAGSLGFSACVMVFISLDELLPPAEKYGEQHLSIYGAVCGMLVMAASPLLL